MFPTEEQRNNALRDAGIAPSQPGTLTSSSIAPSSPITPVQPNPVTTYPVEKLDVTTSPLPSTGPEDKANMLSSEIEKLNLALTGQTAFRAEQEKLQNYPELLKTQTDLSSRLKAIQNEALAIPLQLEQESIGRGRTQAAIVGLTNEKLRTNAIQALGISSLLESSKGNLATAQSLVDRAVAQRFDPIKEMIEAKTANLKLIMDSPEYSLADKNRAQRQLDEQNNQKRRVERFQENNKIVQAMAATAVSLNPGNQSALLAAQQVLGLDPTDPGYLSRAFGLIGQFQSDPNKLKNDLLERQYKQAQINQAEANVRKINAEIKNMNPIIPTEGNAAYINAFNNAIAGAGAESTKTAKNVFAGYLNRGDTKGARTYIVRTAMSQAGVDQQNQAIGRSQAISAMDDIQSLLAQAKAKGADTNIFTGSLVNAANKLGTSPNPDLSYIGSRMEQALITYRKGMTGVAFGDIENKSYKKIFPDITNIEALNIAKMQALKDTMNANNRTALGFYIGQDNYDQLFPTGGTATLPSDTSQSFTRLLGPDGIPYNVPNANVEAFLKAGGKRL